jgi:hypothetical protein
MTYTQYSMSKVIIKAAEEADLPAVREIHTYYVLNTVS